MTDTNRFIDSFASSQESASSLERTPPLSQRKRRFEMAAGLSEPRLTKRKRATADAVLNLAEAVKSMSEQLALPLSLPEGPPSTPQRHAKAVALICDAHDLTPQEKEDALLLLDDPEKKTFINTFISTTSPYRSAILRRKLFQ